MAAIVARVGSVRMLSVPPEPLGRPILQNNPTVYTFTITGGPCAGKTTAMAKLSLRLQNMGFDVFVVPEVRDSA